MINGQKKSTTALDIYLEGYRTGFFNSGVPESKKFFVALRDAVIYELKTQGYCVLADNFLESGKCRMDIVAYAAFADIVMGFKNNTLADVESNPKYKDYLPYISDMAGRPLLWSQCKQFVEEPIPREKLLETIRTAKQIVRSYHMRNVASNQKSSNEPNNQKKEKTTEEATYRAKKLIEDARAEADKITEEAQSQAKKLTEDARTEADKIKEEAEHQAEKLTEDAQMKAKGIEEQAYEQACTTAQEKTGKLIEQFLAEEQMKYKAELNAEMRKFTDSYIDNSDRAMTVHAEMCDVTNAVQAKWVQALDAAINQMTSVKAEFYSRLHDWQVSLFPKEIKPLAERFLELYRILNVDKLLREEILFDTVEKDEGSDGSNTVNSERAEVSDAHIVGLQKLNKTLTTFLRRFEVSLNGLDLYVYYPEVGDAFDDMWHILDDEETGIGKRIAECVIPGIAKKANDDFGDDVLIPAVVKVETEN